MAKDRQSADTLGGSSGDTEAKGELVEVTPLGLSAEQMAKSNPDAVAALQADAASAAVAAERQRREELDAAFKDDLAYAAEAYKAGKTVTQAKADRHDKLVSENAELRAKVAELTAKVEAGKPGFTASDAEGNATPETGDAAAATAEFEGLWAKATHLHGPMTKTAFLALSRHEPDRARAIAQSAKS